MFKYFAVKLIILLIDGVDKRNNYFVGVQVRCGTWARAHFDVGVSAMPLGHRPVETGVAWNSLLTPSVSKVIILLLDAVYKRNNYFFVGIIIFVFNYLAVKLIILLIDGVDKRTGYLEGLHAGQRWGSSPRSFRCWGKRYAIRPQTCRNMGGLEFLIDAVGKQGNYSAY